MDYSEVQLSDLSLPLMTLGSAAVALLRLQSIDIDTERLMAGLPIVDAKLSEDLLERATARLGHAVVWDRKRDITSLKYPCCIMLSSGDYVVALGLKNNDLQLLDVEAPNAYHSIPATAFQNNIYRRSFQILPSVDSLLHRHSTGVYKRHWFWGHLFLKKRRLIDIVISSLFANVLAIVTSLFTLQVYDRVIPAQSEATLWVLAGGVGLAIIFEALLRIARARLIDSMGRETEVNLTRELFTKLLHMKLDRRPSSPSDLANMVRDFSTVKDFFTTAAVGVAADIPFVFIFLLLVYGIAGNVVWVVVIGAIMILLPGFLLQKKVERLSEEARGGISSASQLLTEITYGLETVKVIQAESLFQKKWEEVIELNALKTTEQRSVSACLTYWASSIQQWAYIMTVIFGVYMVFNSELSIGAIIAIGILTTRTLSPVTQFSQVLSRWKNMMVALKALDTIMLSEQERNPERKYVRRSRLLGNISLGQVRFTYSQRETASINISSLNIKNGQRVALLGTNGSGKSSLLRLISGLYQSFEGDILVDGLDIRQLDPRDLRSNIGYLSQDIVMFRGTLRENLTPSSIKYSDERLLEALSFSGLREFIQHSPEGLDLQILDGGEGLSIGQRQSIGLARLYLQDPSIILLDEPTSALDQSLENAIVDRLGKWIGTRTCIVATHRPQILSQMDYIAVLQQGTIIMYGKRNDVLNKLMAKHN